MTPIFIVSYDGGFEVFSSQNAALAWIHLNPKCANAKAYGPYRINDTHKIYKPNYEIKYPERAEFYLLMLLLEQYKLNLGERISFTEFFKRIIQYPIIHPKIFGSALKYRRRRDILLAILKSGNVWAYGSKVKYVYEYKEHGKNKHFILCVRSDAGLNRGAFLCVGPR